MRLPWEPDFERLMREKETTLRAAETADWNTTRPPITTTHARPATFDCEFCGGRLLSYPALLNHRCDER